MFSARRPVACERCNRQKLKCDSERPCVMCSRAKVACIPRNRNKQSKPIVRQKSEGVSHILVNNDRDRTMVQEMRPTAQSLPEPSSNDIASSHAEHANGESLLASTTSSVRFANRFLNSDQTSPNSTGQSPRDADREYLHVLVGDNQTGDSTTWDLVSLQRPPIAVMEILIDVYLQRAHWFILLFHAPSLKRRFENLWQRLSWSRQDAGQVLVLLLVANLGAMCLLRDDSHRHDRLFKQHHFGLHDFSRRSAAEAKFHLLDVMSDCSVESVQLALLLARYYASTGEPGVGWTLVGMAARNAYASGLHHYPGDTDDPAVCEERRRTWLATKTTDTFSAFFHGRPPSLDCNFDAVLDPYHVEDLDLPSPLANDFTLNRFDCTVDLHTFHRLKFQLYEIMAQALASFRQIRESRQKASQHDLILQIIRRTELQLGDWRNRRPPFFNRDEKETLGDDGRYNTLDRCLDAVQILKLQSITLQAILDSNTIMLHRPVLESATFHPETMSHSLQTTMHAALRISTIPLEIFEKEVALAYILMASLSAAVILCLGPIALPMSAEAHQAKEGLLRIIHACAALKEKSALAKHMSKLLPSLMSKVVQHETHLALSRQAVSNIGHLANDETRTLHSDRSSEYSESRPLTAISLQGTDLSKTWATDLPASDDWLLDTEWTMRPAASEQSVSRTTPPEVANFRDLLDYLPLDGFSALS